VRRGFGQFGPKYLRSGQADVRFGAVVRLMDKNARMEMAMETQVHFIAPDGTQVGPESWGTVCQRIDGGQISPDSLVWWNGAPEWVPASSVRASTSMSSNASAAPSVVGTVAAGGSAGDSLISGFSDQELDDQFMALLKRSWEIFKESEHATAIDEAMLSGVITALLDCGYVLIDVATAGALPYAATAGSTTTTTASTTPVVAADGVAGMGHELRFEEPGVAHRVTVTLDHLTKDPAAAKTLGHLASLVVGYGERVGNFSQVGQAVRQELAASFIASPEPGTVSWNADISSGYVYAEIDLILELSTYVDDKLAVDHALVRKHLAAVVNTLRTFVRARFGSVA